MITNGLEIKGEGTTEDAPAPEAPGASWMRPPPGGPWGRTLKAKPASP